MRGFPLLSDNALSLRKVDKYGRPAANKVLSQAIDEIEVWYWEAVVNVSTADHIKLYPVYTGISMYASDAVEYRWFISDSKK